jgi:hypothetical protein
MWALVLGVFSIFTGEIITFIMLGFILLALNNIAQHLADIKATLKHHRKDQD